MESFILIVHVVLALGITLFVLLQRGKGAEAGASFGGGASNTVFGASGSGNFLTRTTSILAFSFFLTSFALAYFARERADYEADIGIEVQVEVQEDEQAVDETLPVVD
jgi:preprotein translocase subunit SecG